MREIRITTDIYNDTIPRPKSDDSRFLGPSPAEKPLRAPDEPWVEQSLASMSIDEKIGELIATHKHKYGPELIEKYHVGGFVFLGNDLRAENIVATVNRLQRLSPRPLWFGIDAEAGVGARVSDATIFPILMAFGAAGDPELSEKCGRITAREASALGLHAAYGPVIDVVTDPASPAISTRSPGDDADMVTALGRAFVRGITAEGVLPTFKHYPGHGHTHTDSHLDLPVIEATREEVEKIHLRPFEELIESGDAELIMTGHLWLPAYHPERPWPSTLSHLLNVEILRKRLGFEGVLISDAFNMAGLAHAVPDESERAILALEAGNDVILVSDDLDAVVRGVKRGLSEGRLTEERIDESVRRILRAKSRAGLPEKREVDPEAWKTVLNHPEHRAVVQQVCERAFTVVKNEIGTPMIRRDERVLVIALQGTSKIFYRFPADYFTDMFLQEVPGATVKLLSREAGEAERDALMEDAVHADKVLVLGYDWSRIYSAGQLMLINAIIATGKTTAYVSFGAPFHLRQIPRVHAFACGYCSVQPMQRVAVEVLLGRREAVGKLPVKPGMIT